MICQRHQSLEYFIKDRLHLPTAELKLIFDLEFIKDLIA
jgi:hypothetical protein